MEMGKLALIGIGGYLLYEWYMSNYGTTATVAGQTASTTPNVNQSGLATTPTPNNLMVGVCSQSSAAAPLNINQATACGNPTNPQQVQGTNNAGQGVNSNVVAATVATPTNPAVANAIQLAASQDPTYRRDSAGNVLGTPYQWDYHYRAITGRPGPDPRAQGSGWTLGPDTYVTYNQWATWATGHGASLNGMGMGMIFGGPTMSVATPVTHSNVVGKQGMGIGALIRATSTERAIAQGY